MPVEEWVPCAQHAAERALQLDDTIGSAHVSLGTIAWIRDFDWDEAGRRIELAFELEPSDPVSVDAWSWYNAVRGRHAKSLEVAERLVAVAPLDPTYRSFAASRIVFARKYERAIEALLEILATHPDAQEALLWLAFSYQMSGRLEEAVDMWARWNRSVGLEHAAQALEQGYAEAGFQGALRSVVRAEVPAASLKK